MGFTINALRFEATYPGGWRESWAEHLPMPIEFGTTSELVRNYIGS